MKIFFTSPDVQDVWQLHFSQLGGQEYTVPGMFIANLIDQPQPAMPIAPYTPPPQGQQPPPAPEHNGKAFLFEDLGTTEWHVHRDQHQQRLQQDVLM